MNNQYVGVIETVAGWRQALLSRDDDTPNEVMVHVWEGEDKPFAVLAEIEIDSLVGDSIRLNPKTLYHTDDSGGLQIANASLAREMDIWSYHVTLRRDGENWEGKWNHGNGSTGSAKFEPVHDKAELKPYVCNSWAEFKEWADKIRQAGEVCAFRGHGSNQFRLRTSLQRAGRYRLERYCSQTLPEFRSHVEAIEQTRFTLSNGDDYSTLLGLAQHHGLPTPLLDWTRSPYIAAFFAFVDALEWKDSRKDTYVRIYGLANDFVKISTSNVITIPFIRPYVVPLHVGPLHNPRLYAQQGLFMVTNAANVEHILLEAGKARGIEYLVAADVPIKFASEALEDLMYMGLTAATMFPGLDGVCRMMKNSMYSSAKPRAFV